MILNNPFISYDTWYLFSNCMINNKKTHNFPNIFYLRRLVIRRNENLLYNDSEYLLEQI